MSDVSGMTCDEVRAIAAEIALDVLPRDERARALAHLDDCPSCRDLVDSYVRASDSMLVALPDAAVPSAVAAEIRATRPTVTPEPRRRAAAVWLLAAAAAVLLVVVTVAAVVSRRDGDDEPVEVAAQLVAADGATVGSVSLEGGDDPWMWVSLSDVDDATYRCEVVFSDGTSKAVGSVVVTGGHGAWDAPIAVDVADVAEVRVVGPDDVVVASGTI